MRFVSFMRPDGKASFGTIEDATILDAGAVPGVGHTTLKDVIEASELDVLRGVGEPIPMDEVMLLPPLPNPEKILCIGLNYLPHILESGRPHPEYPSIFTRYPASIVGHNVPIERPRASGKFDYEGELALVIGKGGRHIDAARAIDHVAGYTCFNDGSIRDYQNHTTQFWPGKNFERSGSMGPWLITPDEVGDIRDQTLTTRVNGQVEQQAPISDLAIGIPEIIAYASTVLTLVPGDVIVTGTPGGVGQYRDPKLFLEPGMTVEVEVTGVGTLVNGVIDEVA
jgi:2-keto-4-pentenoate hydratase/2-oxohepta-3-ene-1,7-dioic acid hydratase in catechol pathway